MSSRQYFIYILILGSLTALGPFSIDMYLPGFPAIAKDLNTTTVRVALSLSSFFIGISAGQLLYGPLLDKYGRKKPLYFGLVLYILTSIACAATRSVDNFIIFRFVQAIGSCAATVAAMTMVRDLFPVKDNAKVFALLILVLGTSPLVAPTVGGYVTDAWGWQSVFFILAVLAFLMMISVIFGLPQVYQPNNSISLKPKPIILNFIGVIKQPQFYTYSSVGAIAFAGLFAYVSSSPMIFMEIFKIGGKVYGWIFAFLSVGFIGASQCNTLLLRRFRSEEIVRIAIGGQVVVSVVFLLLAVNNLLTLIPTIALIFLFLFSVGVIAPNTSALSLAPFSTNAGSASSVMGAMQMSVGAFASFIVSLAPFPSIVPLTLVMAGSACIAFVVLLVGKKRIVPEQELELR